MHDADDMEAKFSRVYVRMEYHLANRKVFLVAVIGHCLLSIALGAISVSSGTFLLTDAFPFYAANAGTPLPTPTRRCRPGSRSPLSVC
jgi:hypothetical protein